MAEQDRPRWSEARAQAAAAARMRDVVTYVDAAIRDAEARGEFDHLPGAGKPIEGLGTEHDPDRRVRKLVERERIAVLPPSVQLRKDDAELDDLLDHQATEDDAREVVEEFNARVIKARYGLPAGPPLITMPRDVEDTLAAWRSRREARARAAEAAAAELPSARRSGRGGRALRRLLRRPTRE